jgi:hypothetical protein
MYPCRYTRSIILRFFKHIIAFMLCIALVFQFYVIKCNDGMSEDSSRSLSKSNRSLYIEYNSSVEALPDNGYYFLYRIISASFKYFGNYRRLFGDSLCMKLSLISIELIVYALLCSYRKTGRRTSVIAMSVGGHAP